MSYVQYTHEHTLSPVYGSLVRVLQGFYQKRHSENDLVEIVKKHHRFQTFCPVHYSVNIGDWERVGNFAVPDFAKEFPIFKNTNALPNDDPIEAKWSLWDGEKSWKVGKLSIKEQMKYPLLGVCNDTALILRIETGRSGKRNLC